MTLGLGMSYAIEKDARDPLARFREEFRLPPGRIYLDGNSLGPLSRRSEASTLRVLGDWKARGIGGWLDGEPAWFAMAEELGAAMAGLVVAEADDVVVTGSTTINLHQLLATLFRPEGRRSKILLDALGFPSDRYAIESHLRLLGFVPSDHLALVESEDGRTPSEMGPAWRGKSADSEDRADSSAASCRFCPTGSKMAGQQSRSHPWAERHPGRRSVGLSRNLHGKFGNGCPCCMVAPNCPDAKPPSRTNRCDEGNGTGRVSGAGRGPGRIGVERWVRAEGPAPDAAI